MILTVAIPTYNRPDKAKNTVLRLLPQLTSDVKIRILDNCSSTVISDYLVKEIGGIVLDKVEVIRNRVNIGADANFQKCFELCDTPYIWMLGDDDKIEENAVQLILYEVNKYKDYDLIGINFNSNCNTVSRVNPIIIRSTSDLAEKFDHFGNWLFISTSVYKTEEYLKHIRHQAWGAFSMASQVVPPLIAIGNNKTMVLSEKYIVTNIKATEDDPGGKWSDIQMTLSQLTLLEAPVGFKRDEYVNFGRKISVGFVPVGTVFLSILKSINTNIKLIDNYHLYILKQLYKRTIEFRDNKAYEASKYYVVLALLKNKTLLRIIITCVPFLKRRINKSTPFYLFKR